MLEKSKVNQKKSDGVIKVAITPIREGEHNEDDAHG
jgi:hypothetical protein